MSELTRGSGALNDLLGYLDSVESKLAADVVLPDLAQAEELQDEVSGRISELEAELEATRKK